MVPVNNTGLLSIILDQYLLVLSLTELRERPLGGRKRINVIVVTPLDH